jgi:ABC-type branched-subunit amino acid transport system ATPase component
MNSAPAALTPALELRGISVRFGGVQALNDVSFQLANQAGISAIIGPNGAGKTTLLNVLTGIVRPAAGRLLIAGHDMTGRRPDMIFRSKIARTFQGIRLFEHLTVRENVHLAARSAVGAGHSGAASIWFDRRHTARHKAEHALRQVGLPVSLWSELPERLTLLERRLTEIARALTAEPAALLLDEPAAGLNTAEKERLCTLLGVIAASYQCRVVLVEHDMKLVMAIAERIMVMNFGRLLAEGAPDMIRADPAVVEAYLGTAAQHA